MLMFLIHKAMQQPKQHEHILQKQNMKTVTAHEICYEN